MRLPGMGPTIGAFVCSRGVFAVECKRSSAGITIQRVFEARTQLETHIAAIEKLVSVLRAEGIGRGDLAIAVRGFGVTHHMLQMPPATDEMLSPIVDREMHRLEPQLGPAVIGWMPLPALLHGGGEAAGQRSLLAAAAPADVAAEIQERVEDAGFRLLHLTALPVVMQRLLEEFDTASDSAALVAALPDGAFLGFALDGGLRLIVEPPLPPDNDHDSSALAEETELGAMFVRQQFRESEVERVAIVGSSPAFVDLEEALSGRLHVPAASLGVGDVGPASCAALGAVIDAQSAHPLSLGGATRDLAAVRARSLLENASIAAMLVVALLGAWVAIEMFQARQTIASLDAARRRVQTDSFGMAPLRATASQRKNVRDAVAALRLVDYDRVELQQTLAGVAAIVAPPISVDSLQLHRTATGWAATIVGSVRAATNARAVQALHDAYRELPQRANVDSLRLDQLSYADSTAEGTGEVRFQLSFAVRPSRKD